MKYVTFINKQQYEIEILPDGRLLLNGKPQDVDFFPLGGTEFSVIKDNRSLELVIDDKNEGQYEILMAGRLFEALVFDERAFAMANRRGAMKIETGEIHSPMPGLIVQVLVEVGQDVHEGQTLVILESMKMQNELRSPRTGRVQQVMIQQGQTVDKGALLVVIGDA